MSTTLDYNLYNIMEEMSIDHRWDVLTVLMLRTNQLNRCWPSMRTIAKKACPTSGINGNLGMATRAKRWLIEHGAIELVAVDKRIGDELKLAKNRHVYQMTGVIKFCGKVYPYLYISGNNHVSGDETIGAEDVSGGEISGGEISGGEISGGETNLYPESISNHSNLNTPEKKSSSKDDEYILECFGTMKDAETMLTKNRQLTIGWCRYVHWRNNYSDLEKISDPIRYVRKTVAQGKAVPIFDMPEFTDDQLDDHPAIQGDDGVSKVEESDPTLQKFKSVEAVAGDGAVKWLSFQAQIIAKFPDTKRIFDKLKLVHYGNDGYSTVVHHDCSAPFANDLKYLNNLGINRQFGRVMFLHISRYRSCNV